MREYYFIIEIDGVPVYQVEGMRSNVETSAFMRKVCQRLSLQYMDCNITAILYCNSHALSAFDWEDGLCCGQLDLDILLGL